MLLFRGLVLVCVWGASVAAHRRYDGYQVWRMSGDPPKLRHFVSSANEHPSLRDAWMASGFDFVDALVAADLRHHVGLLATRAGVAAHVVMDDVQKSIEAERVDIERRRKFKNSRITLTEYHAFEEIEEYLIDLAATNGNVTLSSVGQTYEGRELWVLRLGISDTEKPAIWVDCGIHAREWITPATCLWILSSLTTQYGLDDSVTQLLDRHDIHMMPVMNPDGYAYTWSDDRLWRKNRNPLNGSLCVGVDLNRNYNGTNWGGVGASNITCEGTYHGEYPFSEPETTAVSQQLLQLSTRKLPMPLPNKDLVLENRRVARESGNFVENRKKENEILSGFVPRENVQEMLDKEVRFRDDNGGEMGNSEEEEARGRDNEDDDYEDDDEDENDVNYYRVRRSAKTVVVRIQTENVPKEVSETDEILKNFEHTKLKTAKERENSEFVANTHEKVQGQISEHLAGGSVAELAEGNGLAISFSLHSYGALWLYAYGYTSELPPAHEELERVSAAGVAGIAAVNGSVYTPGPHFSTIYPSTGTVVDYGYEHVGLVHTYIIESLSDDGYGFQLPESLIAVTAEEVWRGMVAAVLAL